MATGEGISGGSPEPLDPACLNCDASMWCAAGLARWGVIGAYGEQCVLLQDTICPHCRKTVAKVGYFQLPVTPEETAKTGTLNRTMEFDRPMACPKRGYYITLTTKVCPACGALPRELW